MSKPLIVLCTSITILAFAQDVDYLGIQEAVFRYQIKFAPPNSTFCLGSGFKLGKAQDVDPALLNRLRDQRVRSAGQCDEDSGKYIYLVITDVDLSRPSQATVAATIMVDLRSSPGFYRVEQEKGIWKVKGFNSAAIRKLPQPSR